MLGLCARGTGERSSEMAENSETEKPSQNWEQSTDGSVTSTTVVTKTITTITRDRQESDKPQRGPAQQPISLQTQTHLQPTTLDTQANRKSEISPGSVSDSAFNNQRVFKKSLPNNKLTLYLVSRDLIVSDGKIDTLQGVLLVDPEFIREKKVYGQVTLTFRYGREDEEVMGLKFCTEAIVYRAQLYPPYPGADHQEATSSLQQALMRRLGPNAHAFTMEISSVVPPSVRLLPAKEYNGAPIGTSYDVKAYVAERVDEKLHRNTTVRMGIRVIQRTNPPPAPANTLYTVQPQASNRQECTIVQTTRIMDAENEIEEHPQPVAPNAAMEKPFLLSGGSVRLEARLDRAIYAHGDTITVHVSVTNDSHKSVKRLQVLVFQHVDVCMFTSGKFKNVVAVESERESCPIGPGSKLSKNYSLRPIMGSTKNWIALEDNYTKAGTSLASTVVCTGNSEKDRDPFAINVSYYVKVKLLISLMGGVVSLKLPFTLMHRNTEPDLIGFPSPVQDYRDKLESAKDNATDKGNGSVSSAATNDDRDDKKSLISAKKKLLEQMANVDLIEPSDEPGST
ncbi:phosrestin-2-like [Venturia canescens]|uniref:phosrestin-2-like n=1 Tax=Venturia canescens TaxID=32260 RepID=UPI001C9C9F63|nr:phosrestin-2-like [Venturia canescens]